MNKIKTDISWKSLKNILTLCIFVLLTIYCNTLLSIKKNMAMYYL